ncbi:MAG: VOC family protein [Candidatus Sumerlaeota bacterium]
MHRAKLTGVAPILLVKDIRAAAEYWEMKIGFTEMELFGEPPSFAIGTRDEIRIMLAQVHPGTEIVPHWKTVNMMWNAYFWVNDAKALYEELVQRGAIIDYELHMKPYHVLEFGIQDLEGHDVAFGQIVR